MTKYFKDKNNYKYIGKKLPKPFQHFGSACHIHLTDKYYIIHRYMPTSCQNYQYSGSLLIFVRENYEMNSDLHLSEVT